jgi:hypothetical protein
MAEWQYKIERIGSVSDSQLENSLRDQRQKGWELVHILEKAEVTGTNRIQGGF